MRDSFGGFGNMLCGITSLISPFRLTVGGGRGGWRDRFAGRGVVSR